MPDTVLDKMPERMSEYMPERMSDRIVSKSKYIPAKMSDGMSETMSKKSVSGWGSLVIHAILSLGNILSTYWMKC